MAQTKNYKTRFKKLLMVKFPIYKKMDKKLKIIKISILMTSKTL